MPHRGGLGLVGPRNRGIRGTRGGGRRRGPTFGISTRFGNFTFRFFWPLIVFRPRGSTPRSPHPLHFAPPIVPDVITQICAANPQRCAPTTTAASLPSLIPGAIAGIIGVTMVEIMRRAQDLRFDELLREQQADIDRELEKKRLEAERNRVLTLPPAPQLPEQPGMLDEIDVIARPIPSTRVLTDTATVPDISFPRFDPVRPLPLIVPGIAVPRPLARPAAPVQPAPFPVPFVNPLAQPVPFLPFPQPRALPSPRTTTPTPSPRPLPIPLTPVQPRGVPSPFAVPMSFADPQAGPKRGSCECPDTRTKQKKRRNKCSKGFYQEFAGRTRFTSWRAVDCLTGREL